ncbi:Os12g0421300, partial [Oryza sativa Japonica Group]
GEGTRCQCGNRQGAVLANLARLLPTGTVLAYQSLSASFTNQGECFRANRWLSLGLVVFLSAACVFFAFTDSVLYKGKVYYGFALPTRLNLFNLNKKEEQKLFKDLEPELD